MQKPPPWMPGHHIKILLSLNLLKDGVLLLDLHQLFGIKSALLIESWEEDWKLDFVEPIRNSEGKPVAQIPKSEILAK